MVMDYNYMNLTHDWQNAIAGGALGTLIAFGILFAVIILAALYVYQALAWSTIAKKMKFKKSWLAWIPFANQAMQLKLGRFHWAWIFLALVPVLGWVALIILLTIANWRTFEKLRQPGWFAISLPITLVPGVSWIGFILYFIAIGIVAWKN